jgi:hypothetical protein
MRNSQRGQSTALVTSMLMVLMLFVGVVVDVGQAVNRRIAVQIVADTGAYTGAAVMAVGLNQLAYWNARLQDAWAVFTWAHIAAFTVHVTECDAADAAEQAYSAAWNTFNAAFQGVNFAYSNYPFMEAKRVSIYNINDLFPGEADRFKFAEWSISPELGIIPMARDYASLMSVEDVPDGTSPNGVIPGIISSQRSLTYVCGSFPPPKVEVRNRDYDVWYEKADDTVKYFVWIVAAPRTKALLFDSLFGGDIIPEMKAAAVAKPVGGSIKDGESDYITKMEILSKVMTLPAIMDDRYDRGFRPVTH